MHKGVHHFKQSYTRQSAPDLKNTIRRMTLFIYVDNQVIQAFRLLKRWKSIQFMIDLTSKTVIYEKVSQLSFREFNPSKIQLRL